MSTTTTVQDDAEDALEQIDGWARASDVAEEIGSSTNYTREQLNASHEAGRVAKRKRGAIIGSVIDGNTWVLDSKEQAKTVVRLYGSLSEVEMDSMSLDELRAYVKEEIADWTGPIQQKVWYKRD